MATATKKKPAKKGAKKPATGEPVIQIPVKLGNVSIGLKTVSVSASISREFCSIKRMEECLLERRLHATLKLGAVAAGDAPSQKALSGMEGSNEEVTAFIQTNGVGVTSETFSVTLNFNSKEVGKGALDEFAKREAALIVHEVDAVSDDELDDDAPAATQE